MAEYMYGKLENIFQNMSKEAVHLWMAVRKLREKSI